MFKAIKALFTTQDQKDWTLASPGDQLMELLAARPITQAGVSVSAEVALRVPAVKCAVQTIAEAVAQLPLHVYKRGANGARERDSSHPAYALLHDAPNSWTSAYLLKLQIQVDALVRGNGFGFVNRVGGKAREILRLDPTAVTVETQAGMPRYFVQEPGGRRELRHEDVIHIRALSLDGLVGKSPVALAAEAIGIAIAQEGHAGRLFGSGGRPSGLLKFPGKLSKQVAERIGAAWQAFHGGESSGRTAVLEEGGDFVPLTFSSVDLQFQELRTFQVLEIARAFKIPPHLIFELGRATWSNSEEMGRVFLQYCLLPWLKQWQGELQRTVFSADERQTWFAEFLVDDFALADLGSRATAYSQLIAARVLNPNEVRAAENRAPYTGGDEFINPNTMTPAGGGDDEA